MASWYNAILPWLRAAKQTATFLGIAMIALLWGGIHFRFDLERRAVEQAALQNAGNLARAFEENVIRLVKELDKTILFLRSLYEGERMAGWHRFIAEIDSMSDLPLRYSIVDEHGVLRETTVARGPIALDVSDREHFSVHLRTARDDLFISKPLVGRISGKWGLHMTRRIRNGDGSFGGVLGVSLGPEHLAGFYRSVDIGKDGAIALVGFDGVVRARAGARSPPLAADLSAGPLLRAYRSRQVGSYVDRHVIGDNMLVAYRVVKGLPLLVTVALSEREVFEEYWSRKRSYVEAAAALTLLILIAIALSIMHGVRLERAHAALQSSEAQNRKKSQELEVTLAHMSQGLCMFDAEQRVVVCNERYARLYGLTAEQVKPGTSLTRILEHRIANGTFAGAGPDQHVCDRPASVRAALDLVEELSDGRAIAITRRPLPGGGWVTTHEDCTSRLGAERQLEQARKFLHTIIENVPLPIVVKDPGTLRFVLVNHAYEKFIGLPRESVIGKTVYDIFPPEEADVIVRCDNEASDADRRVISAELSLRTPANGRRTITTTRLIVRGEEGGLRHLIAVIEDITERRETERKIVHMAHHDALTDLPNRSLMRDHLKRGLERAGHGEGLAVFFLDLDDFKAVNDTLGHLVGDELLKAVAERLRGCVREEDTVARLGGDEFAILARVEPDNAGTAALAQRVVEAIHAPFDLGRDRVNIGVSIGIAIAPGDSSDPDQLLKNADLALYQAKSAGRGSYRFFEPAMEKRMRARRALELDLREALAKGEFELYYQPFVNLERDEICGFEALLRWNHPERGVVSPAEFISIAEDIGLITRIGEWALRQACAEAMNWPDHIKVAVNLSPAQFRSQNLVQTVLGALAASGLPGRRLELEITESALLQNNEVTLAAMRRLRDLGAGISMDDFGTGYSSLAYLQSFPFDKIKIDRSYVSNLAGGNGSMAILKAIVGLAASLNMTTLAEGVETEEQLEAVRSEGCTEMQGYLFSAPVPAGKIAGLLLSQAEIVENVA